MLAVLEVAEETHQRALTDDTERPVVGVHHRDGTDASGHHAPGGFHSCGFWWTVTTSFDITDLAGIVIRVAPTRLPEQCGKTAMAAALIQRNQPGEFGARF